MKRALIAALALLAFSIAGRGVVGAQTGVQVTNNSGQIDFPSGINFTLRATSAAAPTNLRFNYRVAPDGVKASAVPQCTSGATFTCSYTLVSSPPNLLIPQAEVTYSWSIEAGGLAQDTPDQTITYDDTRFQWKTLTNGNMTIWYNSGSESSARAVLDAAYDSEQKSAGLLQTTVSYPVKLISYATAREMQPAIQSDNAEGVVTLGERVYSDTVMISADVSPEDIARHEVAHIVQAAALSGSYRPPDWVIEGMAVYEQSHPLSGQRDAIESAIESNQVLSVRSMSSASSGALSGNVFLFYGEAWSLVRFLVETYGQQKFGDFFRAIDAGAGTSGALQQVYGFNQDSLENAWRASAGLPPRTAATPEDSGVVPEPTSDNATSSSNIDNGGSNMVLIAGIIGVTVVIAGSLLGLGIYLARRLS
jgi:hypothetical protein